MCSVEGCGKPARAKGWCPMHYRRARLYGDPLMVKLIRGDDTARFWSKVKAPEGSKLERTEGCWLWTAALDRDGYATMRTPTSHMKAHRFAYETFVGPIPAGLVLDHLCRVRHCVNPDHLEPVTNAENLRRGKDAIAA